MKYPKSLLTCLILSGVFFSKQECTATMANQTTNKKQFLVIGDSISNGYTPQLQKLLKDTHKIVHAPGNNGNTNWGQVTNYLFQTASDVHEGMCVGRPAWQGGWVRTQAAGMLVSFLCVLFVVVVLLPVCLFFCLLMFHAYCQLQQPLLR